MFVAECKTQIREIHVVVDEIGHRSLSIGAECGVAVGLGWLEGHGPELIGVGRIDHIACELLCSLKALVFLGLASAHQGEGPRFMGSAKPLFR